jgi:ankyrin repeat protein
MAMSQLFDAIRAGDAELVKVLLAADPSLAEARNPDGATAVLWAAYTRHADLAPILLGAREPDFFEACALGRTDRVTALLKHDPSLARADSADGFSGLGLAIFFGHDAPARLLVEAGADVNRPSQNSFRVTPLHSAIESGKIELLDLLLAHGAAADPEEFLGATPLHAAAGRGQREMAHKLIAAGADPHRKTQDGKNAADLARQFGHNDLAAEITEPQPGAVGGAAGQPLADARRSVTPQSRDRKGAVGDRHLTPAC